MQKARRHNLKLLRPLVGVWFQELFHSPARGSFHLSSQYSFAIGLTGVFSLTGWSRQIHAEFLVLRATQDTATMKEASCKGLSPAMAALSSTFHSLLLLDVAVLQPR